MTTEYPFARMIGKPILPVEMEATDREKLRKSFEEMPDCIRNDDEDTLLATIQKIFHNVAFSESNSNPEHGFLIGLAYLDGIDVEVNHERALDLILKAAESGVPEALEQLVIMYETGKGVDRDYHNAIQWRKRHVNYLKERYEINPVKETIETYLIGLEDLGDSINI